MLGVKGEHIHVLLEIPFRPCGIGRSNNAFHFRQGEFLIKADEELEKEGFVSSQVGIGTSVTASNLELLRDSKRRLVEAKMLDMIQIAKTLKISKEELNEMMNILYEED